MRPKWLSDKRRRSSTVTEAHKRTLAQQASSDRGRVIFCAGLRRLHQKTQVFALESDAAVRARLTHSLEVAHTGIYIVDTLFKRIDETSNKSPLFNQWKQLSTDERLAIRCFVEVACLVHDIGNPPFGHFGEKAICNWFSTCKEEFKNHVVGKQDRALYQDFDAFDGNKQGFRILTTLQRNRSDEYGLNLTYAQLAATIKYPAAKGRKGSFFESERYIKEEIWKESGLAQTGRHPLSLLMEAADDIAYCVSDIEDANDKGLIPPEDLIRAFPNAYKRQQKEHAQRQKKGAPKFELDTAKLITDGRTDLTNLLVLRAADAFVARLTVKKASVLDTAKPLLNDDEGDLKVLKGIANQRIYSSRIVLTNEITGFTVIRGLLDAFQPVLRVQADEFLPIAERMAKRQSVYEEPTRVIVGALTEEPGLISLLPRKHLFAYLDAVKRDRKREAFFRTHLIIDYITGMTDEYALKTYRLVSGQRTYDQAI